MAQATQASTYASGISYFANGGMSNFTYGNGIVHTLTQNARLLPLRSKDMNGATAILDDSYAYDANTNVVSISDGTAGSSNNRSMSFDAADRLIQTNAPNQAWLANTLSYDALDNIRSNSLGTRTYLYQYDATSKRLSQLTLPNASIVRSIGFDAQGNMSSNGSQSYVFDKANRLQSVNGIESYQYDGHGRRVKITRISDNKISYPIYSLTGQLLSDDDQRSNKTIDYVYLNGSLLAKRSAPIGTSTYTTSYLHTDALGSPIAESDAAKAVIRTERYTPYGEPSDQGYDLGPGFTGHSTDAATGLTYMQQRYYDPICGCFLSPDPVQTDPNTGAIFNRYNYANNNPYRFTDPDGRSGVAFVGGVVTESWKALNGGEFDGQSVLGALADGYNGEGDGFASAAFDDATSFIPGGQWGKVGQFGGVLRNAARAEGAVVKEISSAGKAIVGMLRESKGFSNMTKGASVANIGVKIDSAAAKGALKSAGFVESTVGKAGKERTAFTNGKVKFTFAPSKSTGGSSINVSVDGKEILKIRLLDPKSK